MMKTMGNIRRDKESSLFHDRGCSWKDELVPTEHLNELNKRLSAQKGINVEFDIIADANHFFSNADEKLIKSLNKYIEKETALY